jgi:hypothetical protein
MAENSSNFSNEPVHEISAKPNAEQLPIINASGKHANLDQIIAQPVLQPQLTKRQSKTGDHQRVQTAG